MVMKDEILKKKTDFSTLCKEHKVRYLYAFGSSVTDQFNDNTSDIDILVEIDVPDPIERGENCFPCGKLLNYSFTEKLTY
jgi:predicted nucleotidyltransferase